MWQQAIVALVVVAAAAWAAWYWMPAAWRRALATAAGQGARKAGVGESKAAQVARTLGDAPGCSSCESCGSCATPGQPGAAAERADGPFRPVKIVRKS